MNMNANYLFDIFEFTNKENLPDLYVGLAMLTHTNPIPEGITDREIREFIGGHYNALVDAFKGRNREDFAAVVEKCVAEDIERKEAMENK